MVINERFRLPTAVYGVLLDDRGVLLMRRAGSGYRDGQLGLPSGHLEGGEDALSGLIRELREELGVRVKRTACQLGLVMHRSPESAEDSEYMDLFFLVETWSGKPSVVEPDKCSELVWAPIDDLPADLVDYIGVGLRGLREGRRLVLVGW